MPTHLAMRSVLKQFNSNVYIEYSSTILLHNALKNAKYFVFFVLIILNIPKRLSISIPLLR